MYENENYTAPAAAQETAPEATAIIEDASQDTAAQTPVPEASAIVQDAAQEAQTRAQEPEKPKAQADPDDYVRFSKPYTFEGKTYAGISLKAIENLTARDMCEAEKYISKLGIFSPLPEMTMEYVAFIGNKATGQPIEFFMGLPPKDAAKVKNRVTDFFYGED